MEVSVLIIFCRVGLLAVSVDDTRALATVVYAPVVAAVQLLRFLCLRFLDPSSWGLGFRFLVSGFWMLGVECRVFRLGLLRICASCCDQLSQRSKQARS